MIKEAIANYINARAELVRSEKPCEHNFELINTAKAFNNLNHNFTWYEFTYFCKKCGKSKIVSTKNNL